MKRLLYIFVWVLMLACLCGMEDGCTYRPQWVVDPNGISDANAIKTETVMDPKDDKTVEDVKAEQTEEQLPQTEREWSQRLTQKQFEVLRRAGTERAFTGKYYKHDENGVYTCAGCGTELFTSQSKFDSGCGWPAFSYPKDAKTVVETVDRSHGMIRTEITCAKCGGHLGHVFNDGPGPTGLRYCINSAAMGFNSEDSRQNTEDSKKGDEK
ncbi:MAG: peptide-methionine (R)-S-oxide reductase MsrB [Planctomycetota bacterium]|jgi:peptide-methionine (R)-S-oxide reductase